MSFHRKAAGFGRQQRLLGCAAIALAAGAYPAFAQAGDQAPTPPVAATLQVSDNAVGNTDRIIVTASRREETIKETPAAVSAYLGDDFADANVKSLVDLLPSSPNIQIGTVNTNANVSIRGIGYLLQTAGSDPGVAFHVDGVYLAETGLTARNFLDVQRVEVIRGPQGTLFGRNATGGAVNLIPNTPSATPSFGIDGNIGITPGGSRVAGYINGPLSSDDTLTGRLAVQQTNSRGYTTNLFAGGPRKFDQADNYSARGQLMWSPSDTFSTRLSVDYQNEESTGQGYFLLGVPDPTIPLPADLVGQPTGSVEDRENFANQGEKQFEGFGATLVTTLAVGGGELKSTLAYNTSNQFTNNDGDGTAANFTNTFIHQHNRQNFGELIYASDPASAFTYIAGVNYFREHRFQNVTVPISFLPVPVDLGASIDTTSYAAFVRGDYTFDFGLKLFAGARTTKDEKASDEFNNFVGTLQQEDSWSKLTYEFGASYDISPALTAYAKYATGYKGGGFSGGALTAAFNPETNDLIEAGLKGEYLDGALSANLSIFRMKYEDLQVSQIVGVLAAVTNAAEATISGAELEAIAHFSPDFRVEVSGGYLDAQFDQFVTADSARPSLGTLDLAGNRLPMAPEFTGRAAAFYEIPIGAPGTLTSSAEYTWKSRLYYNEFNLPIASQDSVGRINLSLVYDNPDGTWSVGAYARNVTDETVRSNVTVVSALLGSLAIGTLEPGREIGLSFRLTR